MNRKQFGLSTAILAALSAAVVFVVATELFPYHTINHDEAVYLQQAAMLLEGQIAIQPPVPDAFRPWFFVQDGARLYPKYSPVPAAIFAVGELLGNPRLSLALVAAGNVALTAGVVAEAFDRRTGLLAGAFLLASPLFLIDSSVFLPYAPTTFWNLLFALAYFRAAKRGADAEANRRGTDGYASTRTTDNYASMRTTDSYPSVRTTHGYALLAGLAIGVAFFARPYTAVLFAVPFLIHALYSLVVGFTRRRVTRLSLTALGGLAGVAVALGYNAVTTGSPFVFPYEAFAPQDGLGFGHREILGYSREYTPELALRANAEVVSALFTEWVVAGPLGTLLAAVGVAAFVRSAARRAADRTSGSADWTGGGADWTGGSTNRANGGQVQSPARWSSEFSELQARAVLAGLFVSVVAGNVFFWGNLNILGSLADPGDGLIDTFGPYYHFDLLVPTAAFAAHGALLVFDRVRQVVFDRVRAFARTRSEDTPGEVVSSKRITAGVALVGVLLLAGATGAVLGPTVGENATVTDAYERAYQPFEERHLSNAIVFLPTPYGDWLNHPFQHLRNDPGFDGEVVYAVDDGPDNLAVAAAYPNRTYYRYVYRGEWAPYRGESVDPALRRVGVARGEAVAVNATVGVPNHAESVSMRLSTGERVAYYGVNGTPANLSLALEVTNGTARIGGSAVRPVGENASVAVGREEELVVQIFVSDATGGFSYRLELPVQQEDGSVVALSPYREVCLTPRNCNGEAAYVEDSVPEGIRLTTQLRATESNGGGRNATARRTLGHI